jgi:hypothetical protein
VPIKLEGEKRRRKYLTDKIEKFRIRPGGYNHRTGRFTCPSCNLTLALGIVAYPVKVERHPDSPGAGEPPPDWVPNYRQALALRRQAVSKLSHRTPGWRDQKNIVCREGCCCLIRARGEGRAEDELKFLVNPQCPIHGSLVQSGQR